MEKDDQRRSPLKNSASGGEEVGRPETFYPSAYIRGRDRNVGGGI